MACFTVFLAACENHKDIYQAGKSEKVFFLPALLLISFALPWFSSHVNQWAQIFARRTVLAAMKVYNKIIANFNTKDKAAAPSLSSTDLSRSRLWRLTFGPPQSLLIWKRRRHLPARCAKFEARF